jgi:hypothetical protein
VIGSLAVLLSVVGLRLIFDMANLGLLAATPQAKEQLQKYGVQDFMRESGLLGTAKDVRNWLGGLLSGDQLLPPEEDFEFMRELENMSARTNIPVEYILAIIAKETKRTFDPSIKSGTSSATGLVQLLEKTAKEYGTTTKDLRKMTRVQQLPYVEKIITRQSKGTKPRNLVDTYMSVAIPKHVSTAKDKKLYLKGGRVYKANPSWDSENKGYISKETIEKSTSSSKNTR